MSPYQMTFSSYKESPAASETFFIHLLLLLQPDRARLRVSSPFSFLPKLYLEKHFLSEQGVRRLQKKIVGPEIV